MARNHITIDDLSKDLPPALRHAALCLVNEDETALPDPAEYTLFDALVDAFGDQPLGSVNHQRVAWLCVHACEAVVPYWRHLDGDIPLTNLSALRRFLTGDNEQPDWPELQESAIPILDGVPITDCRAPDYFGISNAVAETAKYCHQGDRRAAGEAIWRAWTAITSPLVGLSGNEFDAWLCLRALPAAWRCEGTVETDEVRPPVIRP